MYAPRAPTFLIYKNCCQGSKEGHGHLRERKLLRYTLEKNQQTLSFSSPEENNYIPSVHVVLAVCCFLILNYKIWHKLCFREALTYQFIEMKDQVFSR